MTSSHQQTSRLNTLSAVTIASSTPRWTLPGSNSWWRCRIPPNHQRLCFLISQWLSQVLKVYFFCSWRKELLYFITTSNVMSRYGEIMKLTTREVKLSLFWYHSHTSMSNVITSTSLVAVFQRISYGRHYNFIINIILFDFFSIFLSFDVKYGNYNFNDN